MTAEWFDAGDRPDGAVRALQEQGVAFVRDLVTGDGLRRLRRDLIEILAHSPLGHHEYLGLRTRRSGRLFAKTRAADAVATHPYVLGVLDGLVGEVQLTAPSAIELLPGQPAGHWHHDDKFYPLARPHAEVVCNVLVAIDAFTAANGATSIAVASNHWPEPRKPGSDDPVVVAEMPAGTAVLITGATMHRAGANTTDRSRIGLALEFAAAWLRPQETLTLSVPPAIAIEAPVRLRELLGYGTTENGLGHIGGERASVVFDEVRRP